ncbi:hypothetical protein ACE5IS_09175 [Leptospira wolffii]|uniref:Uncharacterized protein n=1 Tax=Leptospira wolffii TaxID=409998 RepID=A0ABV5BP62_9LEPT
MSLTLAFSTQMSGQLFQSAVSNVCKKFNYGFSFSIEKAQLHVRPGIESAMSYLQDTEVIFIHAPDAEIQEAPLIAEQLLEGGDKELGLAFFKDIANALLSISDSFSVMLAIEDWESDQAIRFLTGNLDDFMKLMSSECSWCIQVFHPKSNLWSCRNDYPLVFQIKSV